MGKQTGGEAFPRPGYESPLGGDHHDCLPQNGMSLRDWLAGRAMQGLLAGGEAATAPEVKGLLAHRAYEIADEMLLVRRAL